MSTAVGPTIDTRTVRRAYLRTSASVDGSAWIVRTLTADAGASPSLGMTTLNASTNLLERTLQDSSLQTETSSSDNDASPSSFLIAIENSSTSFGTSSRPGFPYEIESVGTALRTPFSLSLRRNSATISHD
jgi:hypothetical protein